MIPRRFAPCLAADRPGHQCPGVRRGATHPCELALGRDAAPSWLRCAPATAILPWRSHESCSPMPRDGPCGQHLSEDRSGESAASSAHGVQGDVGAVLTENSDPCIGRQHWQRAVALGGSERCDCVRPSRASARTVTSLAMSDVRWLVAFAGTVTGREPVRATGMYLLRVPANGQQLADVAKSLRACGGRAVEGASAVAPSALWLGVVGEQRGLASAVDLAAVAEAHDEDADLAIVDLRNDAVVTESILPELAELVALHGRADGTRIGECRDALAQERGDTTGDGWIELAQLLCSALGELNPLRQVRAPAPRSGSGVRDRRPRAWRPCVPGTGPRGP